MEKISLARFALPEVEGFYRTKEISSALYVPYRYLVMAGTFTSRNRDIHSFGCSKNAISGPPFYTDAAKARARARSSRNTSNLSNSEVHSVATNDALARI